jgi:hypothetical protein
MTFPLQIVIFACSLLTGIIAHYGVEISNIPTTAALLLVGVAVLLFIAMVLGVIQDWGDWIFGGT